MFTTISTFEECWKYESDATIRVFKALTDASLKQEVVPGHPEHKTLGQIAWHITATISYMVGMTGLKIEGPSAMDESPASVPTSAMKICETYEQTSKSLIEQIKKNWTDASLSTEDAMSWGDVWKKGFTLMALVNHQIHHRGQVNILMRQAGLKVPGIYGPSYEETIAMGMHQ